MAKYPYVVKCNGEYYESGEDVPETEDMAGSKSSLPFSDNDIELEENSAEKKYTKSEIQRMKTEDLQSLATEVGIEDAYETSGNELKKILAEHFGL